MDLVSIIVPVYNVEKYIHQCIDSIINQTYKNIEIILVDDGSPDNCGKICDEYAEKDSRIKVIHKENGGLSDARNHGIDAATGDWLMFVDSDDWLHNHTVEKLHDAVNRYGVSVSICNYKETSGESPCVDTNINAELWTPKDLYLEKQVQATIACGKLYHKNCFNEIRYPVGKIHEDEFVTYRILFAQEKIAFIDQPYYAYFINPDGITKSEWTPKRLDAVRALFEQIRFFKLTKDKELIYISLRKAFWNLSNQQALCSKDKYPKEYRYIKKSINKMLLFNLRYVFDLSNAYMLEEAHPLFMKYYWLARAVVRKMLRRE
ncbi:MAG: glycosyltransferase family 2 protein [Clostridia bacterium]|nr:glycosyltransferase family 2 protein [Clostridia bacterium]